MTFFGNPMCVILGNYLISHGYGWLLYYDIALMIGGSSVLMAKQQKVSLHSFSGKYNPIAFCVQKNHIIFKSTGFVYEQVNTENSLMKEESNAL